MTRISGGDLREGKADFVDLGRALIADPNFPNKTMTENIADIRKCILCVRARSLLLNHL